jgi:hypothetical protein
MIVQNPTTIGVLPIQRAVAAASPHAWRDALVTVVGDGQRVVLVDLDGVPSLLVTDAVVRTGDPVAFHPVAEILAVGGIWYTARA